MKVIVLVDTCNYTLYIWWPTSIKHNTDKQSTIQVCQTQNKYVKHSTRLKITAQTCKTQHKQMKTQQRDLKTEHTQAEGEIGYQPSLLLTSNICGHLLFL